MPKAIVIRANPVPTGPDAPVNRAAVEEISAEQLGEGPVTVEVSHSSLNYKDAIVLAGDPGIVRSTPLVAGIDLVGTVVESSDARWDAGDKVLVNGAGMSENHPGGLSELAKPPVEALIRLPDELSPARAAALGTAGYTAALCVLRLQEAGIVSSAERPILVTGATGGVGSVATMLLAGLGHEVAALTGRVEDFGDYLSELGANQIVDRGELSAPGRPLQKQSWAGAVDVLGGDVLANVLAQTEYGGTVTACGMAASGALPASIMPFILRSVTLAGIDSVQAPLADREAAWKLLAEQVDLTALDVITQTIGLDDTFEMAKKLLAGMSYGRIVVDMNL
ncbi:MDR family oxidoreductase [Propionibacterium sp.]|uniref:MDR family oxidoreductase n=1 Tax=Propionibacterium sp. TaxID=1977903 RepID=UPI0039EBB312